MMSTTRKAVLKPFEDKKDYMNDRVEHGIETYRKGWARVTVTDPDGKPVPAARVKIRQTGHDFKYGANLFMLDEFSAAEQNRKYEQQFADAFNLATLPFYWNTLEPEPGKPRFAKDSPKIYRRPAPDLCLEYCERHGIEPKAHCLNYESFTPAWAVGPVMTEKRLLEKRFRELAERYAARIPSWEVTNETFWGMNLHRLNFYDEPDFVEWSFDTADRYFHTNRLIINEAHCRIWDNEHFYGNRSPYFMQVERALAHGARVDSVGMQFHMFYRAEQELKETAQYYDPERIFQVLDTYARLGTSLQITEMTIPAYSNAGEDEELQAEIIRNLYRMWFSHPAMEAIIYWNLVDGFAYGTTPGDMAAGENYFYGGLIRYDFTPKPAYLAIRDLFEKTWRTNLEAATDADGVVDFKGFYGEYEVEIDADSRHRTRAFHLGRGLNPKLTVSLA